MNAERIDSEKIATLHLKAHGSIFLNELTDGSTVIDCNCGAPLGAFDEGQFYWTITDADLESWR